MGHHHFFIEFRLRGYAKEYAKWARSRAKKEANRLHVYRIKKQKPVSHITLFGPAETSDLKLVENELKRIGRKYTLVPFKIKGIGNFPNPDKKVIYLNIDPSFELERFRYELAQSLLKISTNYTKRDPYQKYKFHSTIGEFVTNNDSKFEKLYNCVENQCSLITRGSVNRCVNEFLDNNEFLHLFSSVGSHVIL